MSKTAKNGRKCRAGLGEGIRGVWPAAKWKEHLPRAEKRPWMPPKIPDLPPRADRNAFEMHSRGMKQKEIAAEQHRSQPTVSRGIAAVEHWLAKTLPEDNGNLTAFERFRVGMVRHRIYLEHLKSRAEEEYERSRKTLKIERVRTKVYPEGRKADGKLVTETTTDVYPKHQLGRVSYLHFINKVEQQLAQLEGGWLSPGTKNISCDMPIDIEERDRWDRQVKRQESQIVELQAKLAAAEGKAALGAAPSSPATEGAQTLTLTLSQGERGREKRAEHEYEIAKNGPDSGSKPPIVNDPIPVEAETCVETVASNHSRAKEVSNLNKTASAPSLVQLGSGGGQQSADGMLPVVKELEENPRPQWEDKYRQEALDYHCRKFNLPPASLEQATGIPDPLKMSPRLWIERGFPYMISIDDSIPCDRENQLEIGHIVRLQLPVVLSGPGTRVYGWPEG